MSVTAVPILPVKRGYLVWLWIGVAAAVLIAAALAYAGTPFHQTASGLRYQVLKGGKGDRNPLDTEVALANYVGRLSDGTVFDQSQQPTPLPVSGVVPGFSEGLKLMTKGARYRFWIPGKLGYGTQGQGPIPPNATLVFDVDLLDLRSQDEIRQLQLQQQLQQQMMQGQGQPGLPGAPPPHP